MICVGKRTFKSCEKLHINAAFYCDYDNYIITEKVKMRTYNIQSGVNSLETD